MAPEAQTLTTEDGLGLSAEVHRASEPRGTVVIGGAMAVPQGFYRPFAAFLAEGGLNAVTFDYRGVGRSAPERLRGFPARMRDWGEKDLPAVLAFAQGVGPGLPVSYVGHSAGGQLLGLVPEPKLRRVVFVAAQSGYWGHWSGLYKLQMFLLWHAAIPTFCHLFGRLPMALLGQGLDVPKGVGLEWAAWGRDPECIRSYARTLPRETFAVTAPIRSYAIADDLGYGPEEAVRALAGFYARAQVEVKVVRPGDVGQKRLGHFGFFRPAVAGTLWAEARAFLSG